jgi:hypothetical protein
MSDNSYLLVALATGETTSGLNREPRKPTPSNGYITQKTCSFNLHNAEKDFGYLKN